MVSIKFVCVNFNNSDYTKKLCSSLLAQIGLGDFFSIECFVVDNSDDLIDSDSIKNYCDDYLWINYIRASGNLGYFNGLNLGLKYLKNSESAYVVICNNDLVFDNFFCSLLVGKKFNNDIYAICPDVVTKDGFHQNPHILNKIGWSRRFQFDLYFSHYYLARLMSWVLRVVRPVKSSPLQSPVGCELHMGIGACYILSPEFLKIFNQLDYPHFLYGEEAYFSNQIHSSGGILWFDPDLVVHHAESATLSKVPKRTAYEFSKSGYPSYRRML